MDPVSILGMLASGGGRQKSKSPPAAPSDTISTIRHSFAGVFAFGILGVTVMLGIPVVGWYVGTVFLLVTVILGFRHHKLA